ncbi:type II secretion system F family protein [Microlunatus flavus]|uniref:Tight adherence protein B n=1 Tax=Microlunatus flavus TaxID=1036181 RepID=A0A1H9A1Y3_9ACTN|nr:type II secretion system F family protein [Microlunatus flavus]SEP70531.1 tight adherence protein B [Microlunatus flavus]
MIWIFAGLLAFVTLALGAAYQFGADARSRRLVYVGTLAGTSKEETPRGRFAAANLSFSRTRLGRSLTQSLDSAGITQPPLAVLLVVVAVSIVVPYALGRVLAPAFGVLGVISGIVLLRLWTGWARARRKERFIQQIPELARVLANATNAGLSITTAWVVAEAEMEEPAKTEVKRLNAAVRFGASLEDAMLALNDRLPSREVRVLMSTLVVSARAGGSLIKALRDISRTLDDRKEVRREVRTILAQARSTAWIVSVMGIGILLVLNVVQPGLVDKMTHRLIGQAALVFALALYVIGHVVVHRLTAVER